MTVTTGCQTCDLYGPSVCDEHNRRKNLPGTCGRCGKSLFWWCGAWRDGPSSNQPHQCVKARLRW